MPENLLELEDILEEFENISEQEALVDDGHSIEVDEGYRLPSEMFEVQNAIEKCSDCATTDQYSLNPDLLEVEEATEAIRETPTPSEDKLRYIEPDE
jgi:hypothetical protein